MAHQFIEMQALNEPTPQNRMVRRVRQPNLRPAPSTTTITANNSQRQLAQHMTIAGSFLDFALFVADVEHLKYLLDAGKQNIRYYNFLIVLIGLSLCLQIIVVVLMYIVGFRQAEPHTITHHHHRDDEDCDNAEEDGCEETSQSTQDNSFFEKLQSMNNSPAFYNRIVIILVTFIAIINVFVTVFGDRSSADLIQKYRSGENITKF